MLSTPWLAHASWCLWGALPRWVLVDHTGSTMQQHVINQNHLPPKTAVPHKMQLLFLPLQVWTPYWPWKDTLFSPTALYRDPALRQHPLEFSQKLNAIIYINTQCAAKSGRQDVVRQLVTLLKESNSTLSVHSFGKCDPNMPKAELDKFHEDDTDITRLHKKVDYFRRYKFCIVGSLLM